jgi:hypothetical protein
MYRPPENNWEIRRRTIPIGSIYCPGSFESLLYRIAETPTRATPVKITPTDVQWWR